MTKQNILLVEGPDDKNTIEGLLKRYSIPYNFTIIVGGGIDNLLSSLDLYLKNATAYGVIGIVADADTSVNSRWQQIKDHIMKTGKYQCKKMPLNPKGMIIDAIQPQWDAKVGIWIMPDNIYQGTLENFLLDMINKEDPLLTEVENKLTDLENKNINRYRTIDRNKAKIHTFLSWDKLPGKSLNTAIVSHVLTPNTLTAQLFMEWIKELYKN